MASVFDEYAQECMAEQAKETAVKLLKEGVPANYCKSDSFPLYQRN